MNSLEISAKKTPKKKTSDPAVIVSSAKVAEKLIITDLEEPQGQIEDQQNKVSRRYMRGIINLKHNHGVYQAPLMALSHQIRPM